jgi:SNF2 family DNA or RNA helicase
VLPIELSSRHQRIYQTRLQRERQKILRLIDDLDANRFTILTSLTTLRQLSLDPALVDEAHENVGSAKIDALLEMLADVVGEGHRALVFSQFTGFLQRVRDRLDSSAIPYAYLDGRTRKRQQAVDTFKRGDVPVFVISLKAGGVGLNLAEADYVFVLDPWWNPAVEAQAVDRAHRIGQTKNVMVYRLVSQDTIETKVMALKARKEELFSSVMEEDGGFGGALSADDIRGLFD